MNTITWFELPAQDLGRAQRFYESVLCVALRRETFGPMKLEMALFPYRKGQAVGGALVQDARFRPSPDGTVVYLDAGTDLDGCLRRAQAAGGKVAMPRTDIGAPGFIAMIIDTEGNRVGLNECRRE